MLLDVGESVLDVGDVGEGELDVGSIGESELDVGCVSLLHPLLHKLPTVTVM